MNVRHVAQLALVFVILTSTGANADGEPTRYDVLVDLIEKNARWQRFRAINRVVLPQECIIEFKDEQTPWHDGRVMEEYVATAHLADIAPQSIDATEGVLYLSSKAGGEFVTNSHRLFEFPENTDGEEIRRSIFVSGGGACTAKGCEKPARPSQSMEIILHNNRGVSSDFEDQLDKVTDAIAELIAICTKSES